MTKETVVELKQPTTFAGLSDRVEAAIEKAYWSMDAMRSGYAPHPFKKSERDSFKDAIREMLLELRK